MSEADRILFALGDASRRAMIEALTAQPMSVSKLAEHLGVTLTAVGQHLTVLEDCGLVTTHKTGRTRTCQLVAGGFAPLEQWIRDRRSPLERKLDALGSLLDED